MAFRKHKNSKAWFYLKGLIAAMTPAFAAKAMRKRLLASARYYDAGDLQGRVDYYCKQKNSFELSDAAVTMSSLSPKKQSAYYFDLLDVMRYFPGARFDHLFGDIIEVPKTPTLLKSRPVGGDNAHSILLKLNRVRHYNFIDDELAYADKRDAIAWRGKAASDHHRVDVCRRYFDSPRCDIAVSIPLKDTGSTEFTRPPLSIAEQLQNKFILSLEGNDVATNLKWIMSSNSLCFMRKPRYETWFMEGRLEPGRHYVLLEDDFSDLEEKMDYYLANPAEAEAIISEAQHYVSQFLDQRRERLISTLVMQKYLQMSGQLP